VRPRGGRLGQLLLYGLLAGVSAIVLVLAINQIGGATSSARVERETVTAAEGVVQSTVTGTGNVEPVTDDDVNFQASGTLTHVDVKVGQHVTKGQLLATLDPTSAELTLKEAEAQLVADEDTLTSDEDTLTSAEDSSATTTTTPTTTGTTSGSSGGSSTSTGSATSSASSAASIASDELTIDKDEQAVKSDKTAVAQTKLRAPEAGTIVSLESLAAGDSVSSGSDASASSASDSAGSDSTGSSTAAASTSSTSSSSSSSSGFAEIASLHRLSMTVSFDESDISKLKVGQTATVTLEALTGVELAAKVTAVSPLGTTSSSVVSYDATLTLEQQDARVKPGMSASAAVIVSQGKGVTVPNDAVNGTGSLGTVTEDVNGKSVTKQVVVGQRGDSRTVITSGLAAGSQLYVTTTLPSTTATTASGSSSSGTLGGLSGSSGFGAAGGGVAGGGTGRGGPP
jgi:multidrug efflux pump subunit AcrA (membrane-fusion protein)